MDGKRGVYGVNAPKPKKKKVISNIPLCTERCKDCKYSLKCGKDENLNGSNWCCTYILLEKKPRGCPAGNKCTKYVKTTTKAEEHKDRWRDYDATYNKD